MKSFSVDTYLSKNNKLIIYLWFIIPFVAAIFEVAKGSGSINNYLIFKQVFWHTYNEQHLYNLYPSEYLDKNHYGPLFSVIILPFALLPNYIGATLWCLCNVFVLFYAINELEITQKSKNLIFTISLIETLTSVQNMQFNPMLTGWIILAYVAVKKDKIVIATLLICLGTFVKIYGIVGLPFIFFTKDRIKFISYIFLWAVVLTLLPMIISSPEFILKTYKDWFLVLVEKNMQNITSYQNEGMTDISIMGLFKRITGFHHISNIYFLVPGAIFMILPLFRFSKNQNNVFQLTYLAQILIGLVIFSTSSESPTYVIAVTGFSIWYILDCNTRRKYKNMLLILLFVLTILSPTDLFPKYLKEQYVVKYSLKALPCVITWFLISYQLLFSKFKESVKYA